MATRFDAVEAGLKRLATRRAYMPLQDLTLARLLNHVSDDLVARLRTALKSYGLTDWSLRTLLMLQSGREEAISMAELSLMTGEAPANMTRICDELVRRGLATRSSSPADRRKVLLALTPEAEAMLDEVLPNVWGRLEWLMQGFAPEEKAELERLLKRLGERMEAETGQGARAHGVEPPDAPARRDKGAA